MASDAPLTYGQLSTWRSIETFAEDRLSEVNVPATWDLRGLDTPVVLDALQRLTDRHESLRTTYHVVGGQPVQRVHDGVTPRVELLDRPASAPVDPVLTTRELYNRAFPVTGDVGWHCVLATTDGQPEFLALSFSHLVVDVWAVQELEEQFRKLAVDEGSDNPLGPSPRELALLQHGEAWASRRQGAEKYWRKALANDLVRNLPVLADRPEERRIQATLTSHRLAGLAADVAKTHGISPQSVLTAATAAALARIVGRDRVMLSVMCANRFDPQWLSMISTMNQLIPLACEADGQATLVQFLKRTHLKALLAYRHGSYDVDMAAGLAAELRAAEGRDFEHDCWFNYVTEPGPEPGAHTGPEPLAELSWSAPPRNAGHPFYVRVNGDGRTWASITLRVDPDLVPAEALVGALRTMASFVLRASTEPESTVGGLRADDDANADTTALPAELFPGKVETRQAATAQLPLLQVR